MTNIAFALWITATLVALAAMGIRASCQSHRLRRLIAEHRAKTRVDPCWQNDEDLWRDALRDGDDDWPHGRYTTKADMMRECEIYVEGHCVE